MSEEVRPADAKVTVSLAAAANLRRADPDDVARALAFALRHRGRKRVDSAGEAMARITAERLVEHLAASGFVVMRKSSRARTRPPAGRDTNEKRRGERVELPTYKLRMLKHLWKIQRTKLTRS